MKNSKFSFAFFLIFLVFSANFIFAAPKQSAPKTIDLTKLGATILYAQVYNMLMEADNFNGTRIKMDGTYYENTDIEQGPPFQCIIVTDITGCCSAGFDVLKANDSIKFPKHLSQVEVEGTFTVKEEDGITRTYLVVDKLSVL